MTDNLDKDFWKTKKIEEFSPEEWEAVCDGCAKCCLFKLTDPDSDTVYFTNVVCRYLDLETCKCTDYENRHENVPDCVYVTAKIAHDANWLPKTCAYRMLAKGQGLPWWHPLVSGDPGSVHLVGASVLGKVVSEEVVDLSDLEDMVVNWFD